MNNKNIRDIEADLLKTAKTNIKENKETMIDNIIKRNKNIITEKENHHTKDLRENMIKLRNKKDRVKSIYQRKSIMNKNEFKKKQSTKQKERNGKQIDLKSLMNWQ